MASAGCVFGCTFGNLMHHCRAEKHSLHSCMVQMRRVLKAGGKAVIKSSGEDRVFLAQGMGMHRVMKAQARHFPELRTCKRIDSKAGHIGIVFGAAASILIAFECMSGSTGDLPGLTLLGGLGEGAEPAAVLGIDVLRRRPQLVLQDGSVFI